MFAAGAAIGFFLEKTMRISEKTIGETRQWGATLGFYAPRAST